MNILKIKETSEYRNLFNEVVSGPCKAYMKGPLQPITTSLQLTQENIRFIPALVLVLKEFGPLLKSLLQLFCSEASWKKIFVFQARDEF